jgi:hypothetical protein
VARARIERRAFLRIFAQHAAAFLFPFVFVKLLAPPPLMNFLRRSLDYALLGGFKRKVSPARDRRQRRGLIDATRLHLWQVHRLPSGFRWKLSWYSRGSIKLLLKRCGILRKSICPAVSLDVRATYPPRVTHSRSQQEAERREEAMVPPSFRARISYCLIFFWHHALFRRSTLTI